MSKQLFKRNNQVAAAAASGTAQVAPTWNLLTSFDGASILAAGVSAAPGYQPPQATRVLHGSVYLVTLRGMLFKQGGFAAGGAAFTLPVGWRPANFLAFSVRSDGNIIGALNILANGTVVNAHGGSFLGLDGVSFWTN